ncbi:TetR family transcriptional regulator [Antribacter sp. KLBMP9083]|uniref:TetR family transcriptional regulator n=1 Tax=Antribacter soli TaxID=2910976 RepID=A0AA41QFA3_9MICO|nr:TetR/AcrR family transcriptional regulator [Antribacter soli]MCF4121596.1 TetR family transcriptional regulator [Antribacter soli]
MTPTKIRALDAAIELVGTAGLRALTHARVDERAGLPKGSTSNYFRTRAALTTGVVEWMAQRELADMRPPEPPASAAGLVDLLSGMIEYATGPNRTLTAARITLFGEAGHDPAIRAAVAGGHALMKSWAVAVLTGLGAADPGAGATALMNCCEGFILHRIARGDTADPRPALEVVVRGALGRP